MADTTAAVALLFGTPLSILLATAGLAQFKAIFVLLSSLAQRRGGIPLVQQSVRRAVKVLEASFGPAQKFAPTATHVLLAAILLAVLFSAERILSRLDTRRH